MGIDSIQKFGKGFNWLLQLSMTAMIGFCTFVLSQMWSGWKAHEARDEQTFNTVVRLENQVKNNTGDIYFLTSRIETVSDRQTDGHGNRK